jgi:hypothetical protein
MFHLSDVFLWEYRWIEVFSFDQSLIIEYQCKRIQEVFREQVATIASNLMKLQMHYKLISGFAEDLFLQMISFFSQRSFRVNLMNEFV